MRRIFMSVKFLLGALVISSFALASVSQAEVTGLAIRFGGGCFSDHIGACTLKVTASGSSFDTDGDTVQLRYGKDRTSMRLISKRTISLDSTGRASKRIFNLPGCFQAITGPNGNDKPDLHSRIICESPAS